MGRIRRNEEREWGSGILRNNRKMRRRRRRRRRSTEDIRSLEYYIAEEERTDDFLQGLTTTYADPSTPTGTFLSA